VYTLFGSWSAIDARVAMLRYATQGSAVVVCVP
jgi:hypothetical protein